MEYKVIIQVNNLELIFFLLLLTKNEYYEKNISTIHS